MALIAAACGGGVGSDEPETTTTNPPASSDTSAVDTEDVASALDDMRDPSFPEPLVDPDQIISGGPPPDGIPPIDAPQFISVEAADEWLGDSEPVVYVQMNDDVRAYPVQILIWHEIVNDTVGGVSVAITYCPLCNSAVSYRREVAGQVTTFGTSGRLFASALVMYDRATESLWTHYDGKAVVGALTGQELELISSPLLAWEDFKQSFPDGQVLDRNATGHSRRYGQNPYVGYDDESTNPFLFRGDVDDRAAAKRRVVGVTIDDVARAWTLDVLMDGQASATNTEIGSTPIVIMWKGGQSSALDSGDIASGQDVGSVGVFESTLDGQQLTFVSDGETVRDEETGSSWDITGTAISGQLTGSQLSQIHHLDTFWFAWSTYQPDTDLVDAT